MVAQVGKVRKAVRNRKGTRYSDGEITGTSHYEVHTNR